MNLHDWWPPFLRAELRMLRLDLGREQRKYDKLRDALTREVEKTAALQVEVDRMRLAAGAGVMRPIEQRSPLAARLINRPWPADLVDELRQADVDKQRGDV
jgi:hypothetical protein